MFIVLMQYQSFLPLTSGYDGESLCDLIQSGS